MNIAEIRQFFEFDKTFYPCLNKAINKTTNKTTNNVLGGSKL